LLSLFSGHASFVSSLAFVVALIEFVDCDALREASRTPDLLDGVAGLRVLLDVNVDGDGDVDEKSDEEEEEDEEEEDEAKSSELGALRGVRLATCSPSLSLSLSLSLCCFVVFASASCFASVSLMFRLT
jgi:hypothetical protein